MRLAAAGDAGIDGGSTGDLYVTFLVRTRVESEANGPRVESEARGLRWAIAGLIVSIIGVWWCYRSLRIRQFRWTCSKLSACSKSYSRFRAGANPSNIHSYICSNTSANPNSNKQPHSFACTNTNTFSNSSSYSYPYSNAYSYTHTHCNADIHTHSYSNPGHPHNADAHSNADTHTYPDVYVHSDTRPNANNNYTGIRIRCSCV